MATLAKRARAKKRAARVSSPGRRELPLVIGLLILHQVLLTVIHYIVGPALGVSPMSPALIAATIVAAAVIMALLLWWDLRRPDRLRAVGMVRLQGDHRAATTVAIACVISQMPLLILALQGATVWQAGRASTLAVGHALLVGGPMAGAALVAATVVVGPAIEELLYRGYLQGALARRIGSAGSIAIATLAFMLLHAEIANWVASICLGIATGFCRARTGSIWPGLAVHAANNAFGLWYITLA